MCAFIHGFIHYVTDEPRQYDIDLEAAGRELFAILWSQRQVWTPPLAEQEAVAEQRARDDWPKLPDSTRASWRQLAAQIIDVALVESKK